MWADAVAALKFGLSIWDSKEKTKYLDELIELDKRWWNEYKKGRGNYSNAILDECKLELRRLSKRIFASAGVQRV